MTVTAAALGAVFLGCSGGGAAARFGNVVAGRMPQRETWDGVYYNRVNGYLRLVTHGDNIVGRWKRTTAWGELSGNVEGNVLRFTWIERRYGAAGPSGDVHGAGVFVYYVPRSAGERYAPAELDGKYALDGGTEIADWHWVKQRTPNLMVPFSTENPVDPSLPGEDWQ